MPITSVVADANVLLSAVIGKAALRVFTDFPVDVHATRFNAEEVAEYLPHMAAKYGLSLELVLLQWKLLPIHHHPEADYAAHLPRAVQDLADYAAHLPRAVQDLADRDPDDAHPLALARALSFPLWSNDRDLAGHGVKCFTTARLLKAWGG
ncbi:MAG: PIN domain nuclease [Deltaproteobacteria bacterium]|nr:PIN domain nuclease [Deltaproteobacteria bacterium]